MMKTVTPLALLLLTVACGHAPTAPEAGPVSAVATPTAQSVLAKWRAGQPIRVIVLGNSISAENDPGSGVVAQLRRLVQSKNPASVVDNASVSGWTTVKAIAWLSQAPPLRYDLAFLPLQVNDANQGAPVIEFTNHTQDILDRLVSVQAVPVLVKENDIYSLPESRFGVRYPDYMTAVDQLAAKNRLSVVDGYTPFHAAVVAGGGIEACGLFLEETYIGLHPNQAGHDILFHAYEQWFSR